MLPATADALEAVGIVHPFPIQEMTLPIALLGNDLIGQARTGTGKTLAFAIPLLQRIAVSSDRDYEQVVEPGKPQALVIAPTRELAIQVSGDLALAGKRREARVLTVYGGRAYEPQVAALRAGVDVVVGTPGRLLDLANQGLLDLSHVKVLVLDEADEMLDLGFLPDVENLISRTHELRQTMLFSATMPAAVVGLARKYMRRPVNVRAEGADEGQTVPATAQFVYRVHAMDKVEMIARVLQAENRGLVMIFCRTKRTCQKVADELAERGFAPGAVHGDLGQGAREQALRAFRAGKIDVLVATDVAARGIDVEGVTHVINYQCPEDEKTYLHRIGRTGRAGASGVAITLVDWDDLHRWTMINTALNLPYPEPEETYSNSPNLAHDLGIPPGVTGRLPRSERTRSGLSSEVLEDLGETGRSRAGGAPTSGRRGERNKSGGRADHPPSRSGGARSSEDRPAKDRPAQAASRPRRRTRGGRPIAEGAAESGAPEASNDAAAVSPSTESSAPAESPAPSEGSGRTRRRSRGAGRTDPSTATTEDASPAEVASASETAEPASTPSSGESHESSESEAGAAKRPRRRRRRGSSAATGSDSSDAGSAADEGAADPA